MRTNIAMNVDALVHVAHSPIRNYVVPGLTSSLIGEAGDRGLVRLFQCSRDQVESVTPHSHRYNFHCYVLAGRITNVLWKRFGTRRDSDLYVATTLTYGGTQGSYTKGQPGEPELWRQEPTVYEAGGDYAMGASEVHSIWFSRGTVALIFESAPVADSSIVLEPWVEGEVIPNSCDVQPWMFRRTVTP